MLNCESKEDYLAKVYCIRQALRLLMSDTTMRDWFVSMGSQLIADILSTAGYVSTIPWYGCCTRHLLVQPPMISAQVAQLATVFRLCDRTWEGSSFLKKNFGWDFPNQGGSCHLAKILLQFLACIYDCNYDLPHEKVCSIFLRTIYLCATFRRQIQTSFDPSP